MHFSVVRQMRKLTCSRSNGGASGKRTEVKICALSLVAFRPKPCNLPLSLNCVRKSSLFSEANKIKNSNFQIRINQNLASCNSQGSTNNRSQNLSLQLLQVLELKIIMINFLRHLTKFKSLAYVKGNKKPNKSKKWRMMSLKTNQNSCESLFPTKKSQVVLTFNFNSKLKLVRFEAKNFFHIFALTNV